MIQVSKERAVRLVAAVVDVCQQTGGFWRENEGRSEVDSQLTSELSSFSAPNLLLCTIGQGNLLIEVAADHLMGFTRVVEEPVQTLTPFSCARVVLESSALAAWLLDPTIGPTERVQRSLALRFEGLSQQRRFVHAVGNEEDVGRVASRIDVLETEALQCGLQRVTNQKGTRIAIGQSMPKVTSLIDNTLSKGHVYRLLSSVVHGHHWAVQQLGFEQIPCENEGTGQIALAKGLNPTALAYLCTKTVEAFGEGLLRKAALCGWDTGRLRGMILAPFEQRGVNLALSRS